MSRPIIAILSFPGNNCEVESIRSVKEAGMQPLFFRWNDDVARLKEINGYFVPGGFSYEDRGRAGMVAARDPLMDHLRREAERGKVIIGNCNGAQILVESGLVPLGEGLQMSLARNVVDGAAVGFLSEWVFVTPTCARSRCATSDWEGVMAMPIAHGEGRFTSKDPDLFPELRKNDQIAFSYCTADGEVSDDPAVTPNGSTEAVAGICNPAGNVVALMPHPERTPEGTPYFASMKRWIEEGRKAERGTTAIRRMDFSMQDKKPGKVEIFIDTLIVNNEERTVEQAARRVYPGIRLKQLRYIAPGSGNLREILGTISLFNGNKEIAYIRREGKIGTWDPESREESSTGHHPLGGGIMLLRRDEPDTLAASLGKGSETGVCYVCFDVPEEKLRQRRMLEIFANPHAANLSHLL